MCLAVPAKVLELHGEMADVDFGDGTTRQVSVALVDVIVGKYVLVHAGYAIEVMEPDDAKETLALLKEYISGFEEKS